MAHKWGSPRLRNLVALVAAVFGLGLILSMAMVYYSLPHGVGLDPLGNAGFVLCDDAAAGRICNLGGVCGGLCVAAPRKHEASTQQRHILSITLRWMALIALVVLGIQLVIQPIYMGYLAANGPVAETSGHPGERARAVVRAALCAALPGRWPVQLLHL